MLELKRDSLVFSFPEVHKNAVLRVGFQRTLRIPDDDRTYPLPPGLGPFPLRHVDDFAAEVPSRWLERGGVMLPMYQSEAMWVYFSSSYPCAIKIATGKINAVTGDAWNDPLCRSPQDYVVTPEQPWLDGYCVEKGLIRQFVAMPLGSGYSAEEQLTGAAEHGGLQIIAYPMESGAYEEWRRRQRRRKLEETAFCLAGSASADMGLAPGGRMKQEIYDDPHDFSVWDRGTSSRCFVHICNSLVWRQVTSQDPPTTPPTSKEYTQAGLPWFDYYSDGKALEGGTLLKKLKSIVTLGKEKNEVPLPENESVTPEHVIELRQGLAKDQVREGGKW